MKLDKKVFCIYPFSSIFLGADAGIKPCCSAINDIGNLNNSSIDDILQDENFKSIRRSILEGKWHANCGQCLKLESMNARSERSTLNETNFERWEKIHEETPLTEDFFRLERIDLRWSNTCNLACNYCYEYFSSQWSAIKGIKVNDVKDEYQESLFKLLEKSKDQIINVNLLGGEPLLQKQNQRLIDLLHDKRYYVLTNLAVPMRSNKIADQLLTEKYVDWGVSFETIGDRYEYVRHNAKWDVFNDNLKYVKERNPEVVINAHPLYCTYSAFNLVEYYDYVLENGFTGVYWCIIQNIEGLNVLNLSNELKIKAMNEIERVQKKYPDASGIDHLIDIKDKIKQSMNNIFVEAKERLNVRLGLAPKKQSSGFLSWTDEIETRYLTNKEKSFQELWPEIYNFLKK
jgi:MoaA/NifB/PqqE/SkfB family radical SAM enzyme